MQIKIKPLRALPLMGRNQGGSVGITSFNKNVNKRLQEVIYHIMRIARVFYQKGCGGSVGIFIKQNTMP